MKTFALMLLLASCLSGAPVALSSPVPKEVRNLPNVDAGEWSIQWGGSTYQAILSSGGAFQESLGPTDHLWVGTWAWDVATRKFTVTETHDGGVYWCRWSVVLDCELKGRTEGGISVSLKR